FLDQRGQPDTQTNRSVPPESSPARRAEFVSPGRKSWVNKSPTESRRDGNRSQALRVRTEIQTTTERKSRSGETMQLRTQALGTSGNAPGPKGRKARSHSTTSVLQKETQEDVGAALRPALAKRSEKV